uniref:Uncharacterized protein n=1 Tax=Oryza glaberrima TaxID=4538 RepID=I1QZF2_ORYGL
MGMPELAGRGGAVRCRVGQSADDGRRRGATAAATAEKRSSAAAAGVKRSSDGSWAEKRGGGAKGWQRVVGSLEEISTAVKRFRASGCSRASHIANGLKLPCVIDNLELKNLEPSILVLSNGPSSGSTQSGDNYSEFSRNKNLRACLISQPGR